MGLLTASSEPLRCHCRRSRNQHGAGAPPLLSSAAVLTVAKGEETTTRGPAPAARAALQFWLPHKMQAAGGKEENL